MICKAHLGKTKVEWSFSMCGMWHGIWAKLSHHGFAALEVSAFCSTTGKLFQLNVLIIACRAAVKRFPMQLVKCATLLPGKTFFEVLFCIFELTKPLTLVHYEFSSTVYMLIVAVCTYFKLFSLFLTSFASQALWTAPPLPCPIKCWRLTTNLLTKSTPESTKSWRIPMIPLTFRWTTRAPKLSHPEARSQTRSM